MGTSELAEEEEGTSAQVLVVAEGTSELVQMEEVEESLAPVAGAVVVGGGSVASEVHLAVS